MAEFDVIALDGPGGVGKSTAGRGLARRLGYAFLSSGRIYRALAWWAMGQGWEPKAPPAPELIARASVTAEPAGNGEAELSMMRVNGEGVDADLGSETISQATSVLSADPRVRELADQAQRDAVRALAGTGRFPGLILEGRDIGTVVFPDAPHKLYLTASPEVRAKRRYDELALKDPAVRYEEVLESLKSRDDRDRNREVAPLRPAEDAREIDTSDLTLEQVIQAMAEAVGR